MLCREQHPAHSYPPNSSITASRREIVHSWSFCHLQCPAEVSCGRLHASGQSCSLLRAASQPGLHPTLLWRARTIRTYHCMGEWCFIRPSSTPAVRLRLASSGLRGKHARGLRDSSWKTTEPKWTQIVAWVLSEICARLYVHRKASDCWQGAIGFN